MEDRQKEVLDYIRQNPDATAEDIKKDLNIKYDGALRYHLMELQKEGMINGDKSKNKEV